MLSARVQPQKTDIHPILPLYMVIATTFACCGSMVTLFIHIIILDTGFFNKLIATSTRAIYGGILIALYPLRQFLGAPVICSLADIFGRERILTISIRFTILFYVNIAHAIDIRMLWLLIGSCFLAAIFVPLSVVT